MLSSADSIVVQNGEVEQMTRVSEGSRCNDIALVGRVNGKVKHRTDREERTSTTSFSIGPVTSHIATEDL